MKTSRKVKLLLEEASVDKKQKIENIRIKHIIAQKVRNLRARNSLTQEELAIKAGLPREAITRIESGKHNPTLTTIAKIASTFDKEVKVIFSQIA